MAELVYILRDDLPLALPDSFSNTPLHSISDSLQRILREAIPAAVQLDVVEVEQQLRDAGTIKNSISLDCFWEGDYNLHITRLFSHSEEQVYSTQLTNRPGTPHLQTQMLNIPEGEYVLVDDDISTGFTTRTITDMLDTYNVKISAVQSLVPLNRNLYDVVDARDFILGAEHGGLTVAVGEETTRVSYMHPFVNLVTRAKLSSSAAVKMSASLWRLNADLHAETQLTLGDIENFQGYTSLGFPAEMKVKDFCYSQLKTCSS